MRVLFDHQIFSIQNVGGISRYFCDLLLGLSEVDGIESDLSVLLSNNLHLRSSHPFSTPRFLPNLRFRGKTRLISSINMRQSLRSLRDGKFDVFHPTYYSPYFVSQLNGRPFVLTIYDMIHERFQHQQNKSHWVNEDKRVLAFRANMIIAISNNTKKDIVDIYGLPQEKVSVVHLGYSPVPPPGETEIRIPEDYLLFVGKRDGYKNFRRFTFAVSPLLRAERGLHIICAGEQPFSSEEAELFRQQGIEAQVLFYYASDKDLAFLYSHARAFVFPSEYEGFGLPILEAFAGGCPVAVSNTSSMPEVAGDAAVYFSPYDADEMYTAIKTVALDTERRHDLIAKGLNRLRQFNIQRTAEKTVAVYKRALLEQKTN